MGEDLTDSGSRGVPTSVDVARRAGVSQAAVSLVLGGKAAGRVGKKSQEAILRAARELGYAPNSAARTLRSGRSQVIALVVPDVNNPFFAAVFEGAERAARKEGYSVILITLKDIQDWQQLINEAFTTYAVEGWVLYTMRVPTAPLQELLRDKAILVDGFTNEMPSLLLDIEHGMTAMMQHLIQLGHTRIAHLAAALDDETFLLRHRVYREQLQQHKIPYRDDYQVRSAFTLESSYQAAYQLLTLQDAPTAIVCDSDMLAAGVYQAAHTLHLTIPADVSVTGFDDSLVSRILVPPLTTVAIPTETLGEQTIALLLSVLEKKQTPQFDSLPLSLVVRGSTTAIADK
ncbi:LacI family DNA-binding transcriptional regulator [Dictyobacter aurantiacus]|uniref:LacI family transcriptional regulator n=1 Tax=Dictyobacter aurantiacus TaxID=1936993 RepID=A0A401ZST4_9CHLR|nr:LacI family DNA-binding transcriptional regulator [Dictyobacter aurantiacus]GCE09844.1 LacI family transcriptional regulator [Dictyobacter aurantiacus]